MWKPPLSVDSNFWSNAVKREDFAVDAGDDEVGGAVPCGFRAIPLSLPPQVPRPHSMGGRSISRWAVVRHEGTKPTPSHVCYNTLDYERTR